MWVVNGKWRIVVWVVNGPRNIVVKIISLNLFHDHAAFQCYYCTFSRRGHLHVKWVLMREHCYENSPFTWPRNTIFWDKYSKNYLLQKIPLFYYFYTPVTLAKIHHFIVFALLALGQVQQKLPFAKNTPFLLFLYPCYACKNTSFHRFCVASTCEPMSSYEWAPVFTAKINKERLRLDKNVNKAFSSQMFSQRLPETLFLLIFGFQLKSWHSLGRQVHDVKSNYIKL